MDKKEVLQMLELERLTQPKHKLGQKTKEAIEEAMKLLQRVGKVEITNKQLSIINANTSMQFDCPHCRHNQITKAWNYTHNYCPHCGAKIEWNIKVNDCTKCDNNIIKDCKKVILCQPINSMINKNDSAKNIL